MRKIIAVALLMVFTAFSAKAQSGTNSPYSQFGLGVLTDQGNGPSRGMNGLAYGFHEHNQVNYQNPASYSSLDSLSFIFDAGISGQITNMEENGAKRNANNANLEYVVAGFRIAKHLGVSFGILPFTNIGYNYSNTARVNNIPSTTSVNTTYTNTYSGKGGVHEVYVGMGWEPVKGLAVGFNAGYLWGDYTRSVVNSYSDAYVNTMSKIYTAEIRSYKVDFGLQYTHKVSEKDWVTLGLTYGLGHKLTGDPTLQYITSNSQTATADTTTYSIDKGFQIPHTFGGGLMWNHNHQLLLGVDYQMQKWSDVEAPYFEENGGTNSYRLKKGLYDDRHKFTLGGEYCHGERSRSFLGRIHYRAGVGYATPYLKINGQDGPKEISASIGFGIPIINSYNNRSMLNISGQFSRQVSDSFIKENTFRLNIAFTFNERWFAKFKVE